MTEPVTDAYANLEALNLHELRAIWRDIFACEPPKSGKAYLMLGIAHRRQEREQGGLTPVEKRMIKALSLRAAPTVRSRFLPERAFAIGTQLVRDWHGKTYYIVVTANGFELNGTEYSSLTAVARAITGTHWPGPRFFGLKRGDRLEGEASWVQHASGT